MKNVTHLKLTFFFYSPLDTVGCTNTCECETEIMSSWDTGNETKKKIDLPSVQPC